MEEQENLSLRQEVVEELVVDEARGERQAWSERTTAASTESCRSPLAAINDRSCDQPSTINHRVREISGVRVRGGATYRAGAVVVTTGTFLQAVMHTGESKMPGGRAGDGTTGTLSDCLRRLGSTWSRFKTGTPARLNGRTIDYASLEEQPGDDEPQPFSFLTDDLTQPQLNCWLTQTTAKGHDLIRANLHRAPHVHRADCDARTTILSLDRGQSRSVRRQDVASDLSRARGPQHSGNLLQRHLDQPSPRCPGPDDPQHSVDWSGLRSCATATRSNTTTHRRHNCWRRWRRSSSRLVLRGPDQRYDRL